jgi:flagellar basal-body rod protein FlgG
MNGLYGISQAGMQGAAFQLNVVADNIANVTTSGFESAEPILDSLPSQGELSGAPVVPPAATNVGMGTGTVSVERTQAQAPLVSTGNPLDLALSGPGLFALRDAAGQTVYARQVSLHLQPDGQLLTDQGLSLVPPVRVPAAVTGMTADAKGNLIGRTSTGATQTIATPTVVSFPAPENLGSQAQGLYTESLSSGRPRTPAAGSVSVMSGFRLGSTVDLATEMVELVQAERTFSANTKAMQTLDSLVNNVISIAAR